MRKKPPLLEKPGIGFILYPFPVGEALVRKEGLENFW
jgi:hypothetical protein